MAPGSLTRISALLFFAGLTLSCHREEPARPAEAGAATSAATTSPERAPERKAVKRRREAVEALARRGAGNRRGKFLSQPLGEDGLSPARVFGPLPEDLKGDLARMLDAAGKSPSREAALALIDEARDFNSPEVFSFIRLLLSHEDPEVRGSALSLLEGVRDAGALEVISAALKDTSADVRLQAVEGMGRITAPETAPVLGQAFADEDPGVRQLAFQTAMRQDDTTRLALLESAIKSPATDLAEAAVGVVEGTPSKTTVTLMMEALSATDPLISEKAHDMLFLTFHEDFRDTSAAREWWRTHHREYDENLVLKNP